MNQSAPLVTGRLGLGMVGCGRFGEFCLTAFGTIPSLALIGVTDLDQRRAAATAEAFGVTAYSDYMALLADPRVQVVAINTPPALHASMTLAAAAAGKHVFCEKPLATTMDDATAVLRGVRDARVRLAVGYVMRWNPLYGLLRHLGSLRAGNGPLLGRLRRFALENYAADEDLAVGHWFWDEAISGGIFVEHGVHFFDICDWLMGSHPLAVQALQVRRPGAGPIDTEAATCTFEGVGTASFLHAFTHANRAQYQSVTLDWGFAHGQLTGWIPVALELEVWTDEQGLAVLEGLPTASGESHAVSTRARVRASLGGEPAKPYVYQESVRAGMADLVSAILEDRSPRVSRVDMWASLATAVAAR